MRKLPRFYLVGFAAVFEKLLLVRIANQIYSMLRESDSYKRLLVLTDFLNTVIYSGDEND